MHVALVTDARGLGGAEISLGHLARSAPAQVTVVGVDPAVLRRVAGDRPARLTADTVAGWRAAYADLTPDVVHVNRTTPWEGARALVAALTRPGVRVVTVDQLPLRTTALPQWWRTRALTLRADAAVAVGEASARRLEDFYALGRRSVRSIPNGVPDPGAPPPRPPGRSGVLRVAAVGRLDPVKGHDVLLRAAAGLEGVEVTLVGDGAARDALVALARRLHVRLDITGWCDDVPAALPGYDVLALPSRSEGFPLALVEAMLAGLPAIATTVGSCAEALGDTGLLVPPDDVEALRAALLRLRDDVTLRERLGAAARVRAVDRHTDTVMVASYDALWRDVRAAPRAPRLRVRRPRA